jgi:hypothetical protein
MNASSLTQDEYLAMSPDRQWLAEFFVEEISTHIPFFEKRKCVGEN